MKKVFFLIILIALFGILQATHFFDMFAILGVKVDIVLILVTYIAFTQGSMKGQYVGFGSGLVQHLFSTSLFGMYCFAFTVVGFVMGMVQRKVYANNFITAMILVFFATIIKGAAIGFIAIFFADIDYANFIKNALLLELVLNPILAGFIFWLLNRFAAPVLK